MFHKKSCLWGKLGCHLNPPEKLLGCGFSTPWPLFSLICTIKSELTCIFGLVPEWVSRGRHPLVFSGLVDTQLQPRRFSCGVTKHSENIFLFTPQKRVIFLLKTRIPRALSIYSGLQVITTNKQACGLLTYRHNKRVTWP